MKTILVLVCLLSRGSGLPLTTSTPDTGTRPETPRSSLNPNCLVVAQPNPSEVFGGDPNLAGGTDTTSPVVLALMELIALENERKRVTDTVRDVDEINSSPDNKKVVRAATRNYIDDPHMKVLSLIDDQIQKDSAAFIKGCDPDTEKNCFTYGVLKAVANVLNQIQFALAPSSYDSPMWQVNDSVKQG